MLHSVIPHIPHFSFLYICSENGSSEGTIKRFLEFCMFSTLSLRYKQHRVLQGINTQTDVELLKILSKWPANSEAYKKRGGNHKLVCSSPKPTVNANLGLDSKKLEKK